MPSMAIPIKLAKNGLPMSMSLIASRYQEDKIFHAARIIEKEFNFLAS